MTADKNEVNVFTLTVLLLGLFPGMLCIFWLGSYTFVTIDTLFHYSLLLGLAVFLIHLPFRRRLNRYWAELIAYCWIGWGGLLLALALAVNYFLHGEEKLTVYGLKDGQGLYLPGALLPVEIEIDEPEIKPFSYMRRFEEEEIKADTFATQAAYYTAPGALGYRILLRKELR